MRRKYYAVFGIFMPALLLSGAGLAGNVLVPGANTSANMGLMAPQKPSEPAPSEKKGTTINSREPEKNTERSRGAGIKKGATNDDLPPSVGPWVTNPLLRGLYTKSKRLNRTKIMSFKDLPDPQNKNLPYVLSISFSDKSTLSDEDVKKIRKKLGLSTNEISKNCYLAPRGLMNTDKGTYVFGQSLSHIANVQYAGTIKEYNLRARALCKVGPTVPGNAGLLIMLNDRIQVTLKKVNCPLPTRAVKGLVVTYTGTKKSTCEYQY